MAKYNFIFALMLCVAVGSSCRSVLMETGDITIVTNRNDTIKATAIGNNHLDFLSDLYTPRYPKHIPALRYYKAPQPQKPLSIGLDSVDYVKINAPKYKDTSEYMLVTNTSILPKISAKARLRGRIILSTFVPLYGAISLLELLGKKKKLTDIDSAPITYYQFWKIWYAKDSSSIAEREWEVSNYDAATGTSDTYDEAQIALFSGKQQKAVINGAGNTNKRSWSKALLKFINTRYNLNMTRDEFLQYIDPNKTPEQQTKLFDFIFDKEKELEGSAKNNVLQ